jgi:hypothetical protein
MGYGDSFGMFGFMESIFPILFLIVFFIVIGVFVMAAVQGARRYAKNEASPVLTVDAKVIGKREDVTRHMNSTDDHMHHHHSSTSYYVTFEVESGDRLEFRVEGNEYGLLAEGDYGRLTFQGTRYQGFERVRGSF